MGMLDMVICGKKCYDIISESIPQKLEDGILTADEMASIIKEICDVFGIKAKIKIPDEMLDKFFDIVDYDEGE